MTTRIVLNELLIRDIRQYSMPSILKDRLTTLFIRRYGYTKFDAPNEHCPADEEQVWRITGSTKFSYHGSYLEEK